MAAAISRALSEISTGLSEGLATVIRIAAVSPNPSLNWIGPAPSGRLSAFRLRSISLKAALVSVRVSSSWIWTIERLGSVSDFTANFVGPTGWSVELSAICSSIGRVSSCSIFVASAPGQLVTTEATRTWIAGSLAFGIERYPYMPHIKTASSNTQEM